uniref:Transport inhibitor response 1-like protein n=1 Tax=Ananas comosus var. bracteatus TaxID=296719 RepID=A0A6V7Q5D7_ANACO|nr:unnamed protein product [Ananas comosus var. bracteatus]
MDEGFGAIVVNCKKLTRLAVSGLLTDKAFEYIGSYGKSPFGDAGLLSGIHHFYNMRFVWMSSCKLSLNGCKEVARRLPRLVVEVIRDRPEDEESGAVEKLYMYRSLAGPRDDAPPFVNIL